MDLPSQLMGIFFSMQKKVTYSVEVFSYQEHEENQVRD